MQRFPRPAAPGPWPDERQRLLLGAAVWGDDRALAAWDRWRAITTRAQVTAADSRLLATAYRPLRRLGADDPMVALAGGVYRRSWYLNQLLLRRAAGAIAQLQAASIEVLVLKGAALSVLHYRDLGARPMEDADLLVARGSLDAAVATLAGVGWEVLDTQTEGPLRFGTHVIDGSDTELDLHDYALMQSADDSDLWEASVPLTLIDTETASPGPADQLVHVCAHGLRWDPTPTTRWAVDAATIIASAGAGLDWDRVVERAQARRLTVAIGSALSWLRTSLEADIPAPVLSALRAGPRLRFERAIQAVSSRPATRLGFAVMTYDRYRRFAKLAPARERPDSFAGYLRRSWGLESSAELLLHGGRKLARRSR